MRNFIHTHPTYKQDSHVNERIMYDLAVTCDNISRGQADCPEMFGNPKTKSANITLSRCAKVKEEVDKITEKILTQQEAEVKLKVLESSGGTLEDRIGKSIGVGVMSDGSGHVQM
jgi:Glutamate-cysteine ligase.